MNCKFVFVPCCDAKIKATKKSRSKDQEKQITWD